MECLGDFDFHHIYSSKFVKVEELNLTEEQINESRQINEISLGKIVSDFLTMQTLAREQATHLVITK